MTVCGRDTAPRTSYRRSGISSVITGLNGWAKTASITALGGTDTQRLTGCPPRRYCVGIMSVSRRSWVSLGNRDVTERCGAHPPRYSVDRDASGGDVLSKKKGGALPDNERLRGGGGRPVAKRVQHGGRGPAGVLDGGAAGKTQARQRRFEWNVAQPIPRI